MRDYKRCVRVCVCTGGLMSIHTALDHVEGQTVIMAHMHDTKQVCPYNQSLKLVRGL